MYLLKRREPPAESETVFEIVEGATGTYVKGSKKDHLMKVRISITAEKIHKVTVDRDDNELDRDNWSDGDSEEVRQQRMQQGHQSHQRVQSHQRA